MNPADLRDQLHASLATVTPAPLPVEAVRRAGLRRRRTREGLAGLAVAAAALGVVALLGGGGPGRDALRPGVETTAGPSAAPSAQAPVEPGPTPTTASLDAQTAWEGWKASHPGTASTPFRNQSGTWGATASGTTVTVAEYRDGSFQEAGRVDLTEQDSVAALVMTTLTSEADGVPDVVATGPAGNAVLTSVVMPFEGSYRLAPFNCGGGLGPACTAMPSAELQPGQVVVRQRSCVPDCAEGSGVHLPYAWDGSVFAVRATSRDCRLGLSTWYWQVVAVEVSGGRATITYRVADLRCDTSATPFLEGQGDERQETVSADLPVTGGSGPTAGDLQPGLYEVKLQGRTVTGFAAHPSA